MDPHDLPPLPPGLEDALRRKVKGELRKSMQRMRALVQASARRAHAEAIRARVRPHLAGARAIALFRPIAAKGEVETAGVDADARSAGVRVAYPRVDVVRGEIDFFWVDEPPDDALVEGTFGVPEPRAEATLADPGAFDRVLVPALAFDPDGHRIGYGGGFYDRMLPRCTGAVSIGVCFDLQIIAEVPVTAADRPVDVVITEKRTFSR